MLLIRESKINGKGVFTTVPFQVNDAVLSFPIENVSTKNRRGWAYIGNGRYVGDHYLSFVNHSCNPTTVMMILPTNVSMIALRDIKAGEEITCNYDMTEEDGDHIPCTCGSKKCKGYFLSRMK